MGKELNQLELQKIWDESLLKSWSDNSSGWSIVINFLGGIESDLSKKFHNHTITNDDYEEIQKLLVSFQLSRCLDLSTKGDLEFRASKTARAFVSEHCERLSNCLWSGKHTNKAILDSINNFKWRKKGKKVNEEMHRKHSKINHFSGNIFVSARELSKKSDWATVK